MDKNFWVQVKDTFLDFLVEIGPRAFYAIIILIIGVFCIKIVMQLFKRILKKSKIELSLKTFVESLSIFVLWGLLIFLVGSILGIKASSFLAIFGAVGIAIGLALQGSLANFAGGVLILVFKPFKVGDLIKVNNVLGFVEKIDILYTRVKTYDGLIVTMPNGNVSNSDVDNRTMEPYRRVDLNLKFNYDVDVEYIRKLIVETLNKHPHIINEPEPDAWLDQIGEYELKFVARCWVRSENYYPVYWEQLQAVKKALDENGIEIPVPKRTLYQPQLNQESMRKTDENSVEKK
ncbi:mechanosensitive ion channel family protein [Haloflavibacter putidus]|uniref:Mechanosensitive ion channel family protein n=1 Tax=Haloflavibacter putidus TaxID=2576776 RepID=A0A507ZU23_9FLAO|nr:mechanosensitive ion channel family protein [Haloflavibacter putidus]TQD39754.1 mechanosensitive ion channel family protein [Haloflavibacter putidus]